MPPKCNKVTTSRQISFAHFGDLLQRAWERGKIGEDVHEAIKRGLVPIQKLREQLRWVIEREGDGLRLTEEMIPTNDDEERGMAA